MLIHKSGKITDDLYMIGPSWFPVYLLNIAKPVVIDAGLTCLGQRYLLELQEIVGNKDLNMCLLTHVHFDHCGAISVFKNAFPKIEVWGSEPSKEILERLRAIQLIMKRKTSKNSKKNARLAIHHLICFLLRWWLNFNHRHS